MSREQLESKIADRSARVGVIGLGYVGLPLAVEFSSAGFRTTGFEIDAEQGAVDPRLGVVHPRCADRALARAKSSRAVWTRRSISIVLAELDAICICVPTPLRKTKDPDISMIIEATEKIARSVRPGQLIILESTTYPGHDRGGHPAAVSAPPSDGKALEVGKDIFLAFSPERVDPGNATYGLANTPKVIGGTTESCRALGAALYGSFVETVHVVSSAAAAEMVKLLENTFRSVNIALVNEIAIMCEKLDIDVWEVIDAAATKPFGFMPFYPGPGLGGHCIPVDPHYLAWKLKTLDYRARFIELASEINGEMPRYVTIRIAEALNEAKLPVNGSKILVLGVAYKADTSDVRESPALDIIDLLRAKGADVQYHDPLVPSIRLGDGESASIELSEEVMAGFDCVVLVTNHRGFDAQWILDNSRILVDTRNATGGLAPADHLVRL